MSKPPKKPRSLADAIEGVAAPLAGEVETAPAKAPVAPSASSPGKLAQLNLHIAREDHDRLRQLSFDSKTSLQQLGLEAWNLLLEKRGLPPLKNTTANRPSGLKGA